MIFFSFTDPQTNLAAISTMSKEPITPEERLRKAYIELFHEMQFRATKNAMMNYYEAEELDGKGRVIKNSVHVVTKLC